ncbi:phosphoribosylanthranilate isomerase [Spirulina subsalsa]|uniref:phosphoribosylanthranilate isomerase n=1 Tax=Spirulina subsalsa TaxID=54311 RepID=UPI0002FBFD1A|nr:phosphoribosylanthranilate isomerase [Spirulina subsalsa]
MRIKICGITQPEQGQAIAALGITTLGFICVERSPRFISPPHLKNLLATLPPGLHKIGVFVNASLAEIQEIVTLTGLTGIQLHGEESPRFCQALRQEVPGVELWKALRVKTPQHLQTVEDYAPFVDAVLLDAYHPQQYGGTGQVLNWADLMDFAPPVPWFLAGGLTPENIREALKQVQPSGIDLSSGVERSPGDKDLQKVARLWQVMNNLRELSKH